MRTHGPDEDEITVEVWHNRPGGTVVLFTREFPSEHMEAACDIARTLAEGLRKGYGVTITQRTLTSWHGEL